MKRAEDGTRTRDPNLGKVMLYQLSYFRIADQSLSIAVAKVVIFEKPPNLCTTFLLHFFDHFRK